MIPRALLGLLWALLLHEVFRRTGSNGAWVIGGHRGRLYGDNAKAVEAAARARGHRVIWIANRGQGGDAADAGARVFERGSMKARIAISRAQVLLYSHGEDDLDLFMILLRGRTAPRVYLNHCLALLKAAGVLDPSLSRAPAPLRAIKQWLITRWDTMLAASKEEQDNAKRAYPFAARTIRLGGGAHLDFWHQSRAAAPKKQIYWFPTFRESPHARAELTARINEVIGSSELRSWLIDKGYELLIGGHINSGDSRVELQSPFRRAPLESLVDDICASEVLISDYSGVLFDYLILERPSIFYAFDLDDYLQGRTLYGDYNELDFGAHVRTTAELIGAIKNKVWESEALRQSARARRERSLPTTRSEFAKTSVEAVEQFLSERET